ncbi:MAG TPA: FliI/YscN family ATPase [Acidiferrobacterales bacterium]|nr:FliI/YscN family ATPase [Acidiferrobacterales bacterium]
MKHYLSAVRKSEFIRRTGKVSQFFGLVVESIGPDVFLGELCEIYSRPQIAPIVAEVVGLKDSKILLMPYGELRGISLGNEVIATGRSGQVPVGEALLGRVVDAFCRPLDGKPLPLLETYYPLYPEPLNPLARTRITEVLETSVRSIDSLLTLGRGQRVGIFSGSGVGKSTLLGMIARNMNADVNVIALVGERGREVRDFIEENLGHEGLKRSVIVVATSDQPALARSHAALTATAIAEYFRDQGQDVVLTMDSVTRFAMAQREIGLSIGEPPTSRGYTPSVFAALSKLLERGGTSNSGGSITAFYTVLVEGDDINDPISDSIRAILDGHIILSRDLASQGHYPAIDILNSTSRLLPDLVEDTELRLVQKAITCLSTYVKSKDMVEIGAYRAGTNPNLDAAIKLMPEMDKFLRQGMAESTSRPQAMLKLQSVLRMSS